MSLYVCAASVAGLLLVYQKLKPPGGINLSRSRTEPDGQPSLALSSTAPTPDRSQLPESIEDWRALFSETLKNHRVRAKWSLLFDYFRNEHDVFLWDNRREIYHSPLDDKENRYPRANGFNFLARPHLDRSLTRYPKFTLNSGAMHAARTGAGCDVIIRVMASGGTGESYLQIQRYLNSKKPDILLSSNHVLPMIGEIIFQDITFGLFPKLDTCMRLALSDIWDNSVEDILYMTLEALEGIAYLHENRIAHQDLSTENVTIEWQPSSLARKDSRRPRVYIIDFEDAIMFPEGTKAEDMKVPRHPRNLSEYGRPLPREVRLPEPYYPFPVDIWQFASAFVPFKSGIDEVDVFFSKMLNDIPEERLTAPEAYRELDEFLRSHSSSDLHRPFAMCYT